MLPTPAWELLEHMRIALRDLWDFSTNDKYVEKKWPDDYWPASRRAAFRRRPGMTSVRALEEDLDAFGKLVKDPDSNLYAQIPWGKKDQTLCAKCCSLRTTTAITPGSWFPPPPPGRLEELKSIDNRSNAGCPCTLTGAPICCSRMWIPSS